MGYVVLHSDECAHSISFAIGLSAVSSHNGEYVSGVCQLLQGCVLGAGLCYTSWPLDAIMPAVE
jgi:hypothetical protein